VWPAGRSPWPGRSSRRRSGRGSSCCRSWCCLAENGPGCPPAWPDCHPAVPALRGGLLPAAAPGPPGTARRGPPSHPPGGTALDCRACCPPGPPGPVRGDGMPDSRTPPGPPPGPRRTCPEPNYPAADPAATPLRPRWRPGCTWLARRPLPGPKSPGPPQPPTPLRISRVPAGPGRLTAAGPAACPGPAGVPCPGPGDGPAPGPPVGGRAAGRTARPPRGSPAGAVMPGSPEWQM
jgi:hypothetical protein